MIGELILLAVIVLGLNASFKQEGTFSEYQRASKEQQIKIEEMLERQYYDSLTQHYDSLDIK